MPEPAERESHIAVNNTSLFVKTWTPPADSNAIPILLLHDSLGSTDLWRTFPVKLCAATGRKVIAYDRAGFGRSDAQHELPDHDFVTAEAAVLFPLLCRELGISRCIPFGHSVGGAMALLMAAHHPHLCEAVITESAQAFVEARTIAGIQAAEAGFRRPGGLDRLKKWHGEKAAWVLNAWTQIWLSPEFASWTIRDDLPRITCPVLILHGDRDEYGSDAFPAAIAAGAGGDSELHLLPACGHVPHREQEEHILALIGRFLSRPERIPIPGNRA
jgi:pimeloyl-ACP methyl ester carboxylesterase